VKIYRAIVLQKIPQSQINFCTYAKKKLKKNIRGLKCFKFPCGYAEDSEALEEREFDVAGPSLRAKCSPVCPFDAAAWLGFSANKMTL
jgi:hypothetical protein